MIDIKNLILGAAFGYQWSDLKIFIKSLRKFSNCRVILIFGNKLDKKNKDKLRFYKIEHYIYKRKNSMRVQGLINSKSDVSQRRYEMYEYILKKIKKKTKKRNKTKIYV